MTSARTLLLVALVFSGGAVDTTLAARQSVAQAPAAPATGTRDIVSRITVMVPQNDAELIVDGTTIEGEGPARSFDAAPGRRGAAQESAITVKWRPNTYTEMTRTRSVSFRAGDAVTVDLSAEDPSDRVRVIYVPTPADVAAQMVKLADVSSSDIVYEPGCGDARITIAAVKGGARRGLGIDIDPDRVAESQANVKEAGLEGRIDIRLGDALDVKNMSEATVVFLYMGDHFNMLIRPLLWKELPVGARVVSHRFLMGDWKPDKTVWVASDEGGSYELHLWTITEEVKRRL